MQRLDLPRFESLMAEVFECFDRRPPSANAMAHWVDALHVYPFLTVQDVLRGWLKTKAKAPVIADIANACAEISSRSLEHRAASDAKAFGQRFTFQDPTEYGSKCITAMRKLLRTPKAPGREWARKILDAQAQGACLGYTDPVTGERLPISGEPISDWQARFAREALRQAEFEAEAA